MFRSASCCILRSTKNPITPLQTLAQKRLLTTSPPHQKSRSWKSSAARWGIAIAGIYYYNTSELFAEQPAQYQLDPKADDYDDASTPTLDALTRLSRENKKAQQQPDPLPSALSDETASPENGSPMSSRAASPSGSDSIPSPSPSDPASLEDEASSEGAFNPATGEINWNCPCLGGMAHGPCGEEFRAAFSCFVFSEADPKGMDCIEKFQGMQQCFRAHPDVYAAELEGEDEEELDGALEEERKELVREIKEKRAKEETSGKRLLESDPPIERKPLLGGSRSRSTATDTPSSAVSSTASSSSLSSSSALSSSQTSESHPSSAPSEPSQSPPPNNTFDEDLHLMPKAWHSTSSTPTSSSSSSSSSSDKEGGGEKSPTS